MKKNRLGIVIASVLSFGLFILLVILNSQAFPDNEEEFRSDVIARMGSTAASNHIAMLDEISNAELVELTIYALEQIDSQFQLWLSITFALLAACYISKHQFDSRLKTILGVLYGSAAALIFVRYFGAGANAGMLEVELTARGVNWENGSTLVVGLSRSLLIIAGTVASLWYLNIEQIEATNT